MVSKFDYNNIPDEDKACYVSFEDDIEFKTYFKYKSIELLEKLSFDIIHKVCDLDDNDFDGTSFNLDSVRQEVSRMFRENDLEGLDLINKCLSKVLYAVSIDPDANDDSTEVILELAGLHCRVIEFQEQEFDWYNI